MIYLVIFILSCYFVTIESQYISGTQVLKRYQLYEKLGSLQYFSMSTPQTYILYAPLDEQIGLNRFNINLCFEQLQQNFNFIIVYGIQLVNGKFARSLAESKQINATKDNCTNIDTPTYMLNKLSTGNVQKLIILVEPSQSYNLDRNQIISINIHRKSSNDIRNQLYLTLFLTFFGTTLILFCSIISIVFVSKCIQQKLQARKMQKHLDRIMPSCKYQILMTQKSKQQQECPICLTYIKSDDIVRKISCCHIFHAQCIDLWFGQNHICPVCRKKIQDYQPITI